MICVRLLSLASTQITLVTFGFAFSAGYSLSSQILPGVSWYGTFESKKHSPAADSANTTENNATNSHHVSLPCARDTPLFSKIIFFEYD